MRQETVDLIVEGRDETSEAVQGVREALERLKEVLASIGRVAAAAFGSLAEDEEIDSSRSG